jgi:signal transduction histidine kinase
VDEIVQRILHPMRGYLGRREAVVSIPGTLGTLTADPAALTTALRSLPDNALKFVKPGTVPNVTGRTEVRGASVRLWVEDQGPGIAAGHLGCLFRPFERLDATLPGSGLGLAMVRLPTERMGGRSGAESVVGHGSRFWIELPGTGHL